MIDYSTLATKLILAYTKRVVDNAAVIAKNNRFLLPYVKNGADQQFVSTALNLSHYLTRYRDPNDLDKALDAIDLAFIYQKVEEAGTKAENSNSSYDDILVLQLLAYFKESFFKWVTKPACPQCHRDQDNIVSRGGSSFPKNVPNPDGISVIEHYQCTTCNQDVDFPRLNNPASLLTSRRGRCGEWVNCFLLILHSVTSVKLRYVWNQEDHVWCEYYSSAQKRWIHLDPCENASDYPSLYSENWGKKMSLVIGFNDNYVVDLSKKYITQNKIQAPISATLISKTIAHINAIKTLEFYRAAEGTENEKLEKLYNEVLVMRNSELLDDGNKDRSKPDVPKGRQTGGATWTQERGEDGSS